MNLSSPVAHLNNMRMSAFVYLLLFASFSSFAEHPEEFTEEDIFIDIPTVISATRQRQKLTETPVAITVIDQEIIKASGALKITELFQFVPGMQVYNPTVNTPAVSYHGVSDNNPGRMEVMLNGHSIYLPLLSTVSWETLGLAVSDIDFIEVIRGSNVPAFGSNAFLGAINIVTKHPLNHDGASIETTQGSFDTENYHAAFNGHTGNLDYRLSTNFKKNAGNRFFEDNFDSKAINFSGVLTPTLSDTIDFNMGLSDGFVNIGRASNLNNEFSRREHLTHYQHVRWNHTLNDQHEFKLSFTHNYVDLKGDQLPAAEALAILENISATLAQQAIQLTPSLMPLSGTQQFVDTEHGTTDLYDLEFQHSINSSATLKSVWGIGYRHETAESEILLSGLGRVNEDKFRIFGNTQWQPTKPITINLGGMLERTSYSNARFSPRAAINYLINDTLSLRSAATRAYRTPSLLERNGQIIRFGITGSPVDIDTLPNESIVPELLKSYELGLYKIWPQSGSNLDIRIFHEQISDGIDTFAVDRISTQDFNNEFVTSANVAEWRNVGAELQLHLKPSAQSNVLLSYSYNNVKGFRDRGPARSQRIDSLGGAGAIPRPRAPLHTASLLLSHRFAHKFDMSIGHHYLSDVNWLEGGPRDSFHRTDLLLSKAFNLGQRATLETKLIVQNLFDDIYEDFYAFNEFDRRTFLQLKLNY